MSKPCDKTDCPNYDEYQDYTVSKDYIDTEKEYNDTVKLFQKGRIGNDAMGLQATHFVKNTIHARVSVYKQCNECIHFHKIDNYSKLIAEQAKKDLLSD